MRLTAIVAAAALMGVASPALAQSWESYHEEDYVMGSVILGASQFDVTCAAGEPDPVYSFTTAAFVAPPGMRSVEMVLKIDDQEFVWSAAPIENEGRYDMVGETMNPADIVTINTMMSNGRQMTVSIPSLDVTSTFPLSGSSRVLGDVLSFCG